jgi:hypothetical protein
MAAAVCLEEVLGQLLTDFSVHQPELRVRAVFGGSLAVKTKPSKPMA